MWSKKMFKNKLLLERDKCVSQLKDSLNQDHGTSRDALTEVEELSKTQRDLTVVNLIERRLINHLQHIDLALNKLENGSFGICKDCEEPISEKRLESNLDCERCLSCQESLEQAHGFKKAS